MPLISITSKVLYMHDILCSARHHASECGVTCTIAPQLYSENTIGNRKDEIKIHLIEIPGELALSPSKREDQKKTIKQINLVVKEMLWPELVNFVSINSLEFYNVKQSVYKYMCAGSDGRTERAKASTHNIMLSLI